MGVDQKTLNTKSGEGENQAGSNNQWSWNFAKTIGVHFMIIKLPIVFVLKAWTLEILGRDRPFFQRAIAFLN